MISAPTTDYNPTTDPPSPLTLAAEEDVKCFIIPLIDDTIAERDEVFSVTLSNPSPPAVIITTSTANITIVDNDGRVTAPFAEIYTMSRMFRKL